MKTMDAFTFLRSESEGMVWMPVELGEREQGSGYKLMGESRTRMPTAQGWAFGY